MFHVKHPLFDKRLINSMADSLSSVCFSAEKSVMPACLTPIRSAWILRMGSQTSVYRGGCAYRCSSSASHWCLSLIRGLFRMGCCSLVSEAVHVEAVGLVYAERFTSPDSLLIKADNALIDYVLIFVSRETFRSAKARSLSRFTSSVWL